MSRYLYSVLSIFSVSALIPILSCSHTPRTFKDTAGGAGAGGAQIGGAAGRDGSQPAGRSSTSVGGGEQVAGGSTRDGGTTHAGGQTEDGGGTHEGPVEAGSAGSPPIEASGGAGCAGNDTCTPPLGGTAGRDGSGGASSESGGSDKGGSESGGSESGGSENGGAGGGGAEALPIGSKCTADPQCESNFCTDGFCCDAACDRQCESCKEDGSVGQCRVITGDPLPTRPACAGSAPCKGQCDGTNGAACSYPDDGTACFEATCTDGEVTPERDCNGRGECTRPNSTTCPNGQCATDGSARCEISCTTGSCPSDTYCDTDTGACIPTLDDGQICSDDAQCASNVCADGVCCNQECLGCSACTLELNGQVGSARDGQCLAVVAGKAAPHGTCVSSPSAPCGQTGMCDGDNGCEYPPENTPCDDRSCSGSTLTTSSCDGFHVCVPKNEPCPNSLVCASQTECLTGSCRTDEDCAAGYCAAGVCSTTRQIGDSCENAGECPNGYCVDGYCCNDRCDGECQSCSQAPGQCRTTTSPRTGCAGSGTCGTRYCDGTHASCVFPGGETACPDRCSTDWTAVVPSVCNGSGACGDQTPDDCPLSQYCSTTTATCTSKLSNYSATCSRDVQCSSGLCCSVCVDSNNDNSNCGSCGNRCGANRHCQGGGCGCDYTMPTACGSTCGSWNFESGPGSTEGWGVTMPPGYVAAYVQNGAQSASISSARAYDGSYSLAVPINLADAVWLAVAEVQVCTAGHETNLAGYHVAGYFYLDGPAIESAADAYVEVLVWPSTSYSMQGIYFMEGYVETGNWRRFDVTIPSGAPLIDYIGIAVNPGSGTPTWSGTMYLDNVEFY
jgi:hypothetical protein